MKSGAREAADLCAIYNAMGKNLRHGLWRRVTYVPRLRRHYKRWSKHGLPMSLALRRAREDA